MSRVSRTGRVKADCRRQICTQGRDMRQMCLQNTGVRLPREAKAKRRGRVRWVSYCWKRVDLSDGEVGVRHLAAPAVPHFVCVLLRSLFGQRDGAALGRYVHDFWQWAGGM
jgi:hypothetical protein